MTLVYFSGREPLPFEAKSIEGVEGHVFFRNARLWKGEIESCELVMASSDEILAAYKEAGVKTQKLAPAAAKKAAPKKRTPKAKK